jgi:Bacteriocin-protection, YdeI or OmpD-Associated
MGSVSIAAQRIAGSVRSASAPGSASCIRTCSERPSSWPPSTPASPFGTCSSPPATPIPGRPRSTTVVARTSTATPPTSSSPSSPAAEKTTGKRHFRNRLPYGRYRGSVSASRVPGGVVHKLPADLRRALVANPTALDAWKDITPLARNEFICWVEDAKQATTRARRVRRTQEELEDGQRRPCCWPGCKHRERTGT